MIFRIAIVVVLLCARPAVASDVPEWAVAVFPSGAEFSLENAASDRVRQLGYMFREEVPDHES